MLQVKTGVHIVFGIRNWPDTLQEAVFTQIEWLNLLPRAAINGKPGLDQLDELWLDPAVQQPAHPLQKLCHKIPVTSLRRDSHKRPTVHSSELDEKRWGSRVSAGELT